jgi:hypothetical protein
LSDLDFSLVLAETDIGLKACPEKAESSNHLFKPGVSESDQGNGFRPEMAEVVQWHFRTRIVRKPFHYVLL